MIDPAFVPLEYVRLAEASATGQEALVMFFGILKGHFPDWIYYHSEVHQDVYELAEVYVNNYAYIEGIENDPLYTRTPIHVLRTTTLEKLDDEDVSCILEGLLYSNGAVFFLHRPEKVMTFLWIKEQTIKSFDLPLPSLRSSVG